LIRTEYIRTELETQAVKEEIRHCSPQYRARLSLHPNNKKLLPQERLYRVVTWQQEGNTIHSVVA
jgi:hypothetical protein